MSHRVRHVAVVGGGVAAALTALALARRIPGLSVTWVDTGVPAGAIEDVLGAARPSLGHLHRTLGIDDAELLRRTPCTGRRGTLVVDWAADRFFRGHDRLPAGLPGTPFHLLWLRLAEETGDAPAWIDIAGRAMAGTEDHRPPPALSLDPSAYREVLGALAKHAGIRRIEARAIVVEPTADRQRIGAVRLPDGQTIVADLFVDATGPERALRGALPCDWIGWSGHLPTRTLQVEHHPPMAAPLCYDRLIAEPDGWRIEAYFAHATVVVTGRGDDATAQGSRGAASARDIALHAGRLEAPFYGNVVAIGSAATVMEPIGATALHLLCRQIEWLIGCWPDRDLQPVEIGLYNRHAARDADRMRDFVQLHFVASNRETPFWRFARSRVSESLSDAMSLFGACGRLVPADEDGFEADEWIATLLGLGLRPTERDALARAVPLDHARRCVAAALSRKERIS